MDYVGLKSEIDQDPEALGYKDGQGNRLPPEIILQKINTPNVKWTKNVTDTPIVSFLKVLSKVGAISRLQDFAAASANSHPQRSAAYAGLILIQNAQTIDLTDQDIIDMVNAWQTMGIVTAQQKTTILNLGKSVVSRAENLFGRLLDLEDILRSN